MTTCRRCLIPTEKVIQIAMVKNHKRTLFYPGYVLSEANLGQVPHVKYYRCNRLLGETKGGNPVPMRISEVNRILGKVDELVESEGTMTTNYTVGESVKVINGPFNGLMV